MSASAWRAPATDEGVHLMQAVHRFLVPAIGRVGTTTSPRVFPGLELGELIAAEAELLLQRGPQFRKPEHQEVPRSSGRLRVTRPDRGET